MTVCALLRPVYRSSWNLPPLALFLIAGSASAIAAGLFTGFRTLIFMLYYEREFLGSLSLMDYFNLKDSFASLYIIGTWSGLYFGIKFYQTVQLQNESLLKASSAAHEAQLRMLRYQLNPHFLFNTLNAVSTLVLEKDNETANQVVTRLSTFLRHTLDSDPMRKITLRKEVESVRMYLDIEQVRFEEHLKLKFEIQPDCEAALVPGMILQPLIENAIKYAISISESGGTISIAAEKENGKLCLRVADDGPGIGALNEDGNPDRSTAGSGIGLKNTRERLSVLYGEDHQIELINLRPSGLAVKMCIPFELDE